jgi:hypothetical protein
VKLTLTAWCPFPHSFFRAVDADGYEHRITFIADGLWNHPHPEDLVGQSVDCLLTTYVEVAVSPDFVPVEESAGVAS